LRNKSEVEMPRKIITYIVFFAFLNLVRCYSYQAVTYEEFENTNPDDIKSEDIYIITKDSTKYHSSWWTFSVNDDSVLVKGSKFVGKQEAPFKGKIAVSEIETIEVDKYDGGLTALSVSASILAGIAVVILLASEIGDSGGGCTDNVGLPNYNPYNQ
jgi:hypothetical protein